MENVKQYKERYQEITKMASCRTLPSIGDKFIVYVNFEETEIIGHFSIDKDKNSPEGIEIKGTLIARILIIKYLEDKTRIPNYKSKETISYGMVFDKEIVKYVEKLAYLDINKTLNITDEPTVNVNTEGE